MAGSLSLLGEESLRMVWTGMGRLDQVGNSLL